jgi:hypothetical protein
MSGCAGGTNWFRRYRIQIFGPDHKIVVEAFDDPDVQNVTCYISRAKTGGIKGGLGLAEDTSDAAISCQQVGPIELNDKIKNGKRRATWFSRNVPRWCLKSCRWCVFTMQTQCADLPGLFG